MNLVRIFGAVLIVLGILGIGVAFLIFHLLGADEEKYGSRIRFNRWSISFLITFLAFLLGGIVLYKYF